MTSTTAPVPSSGSGSFATPSAGSVIVERLSKTYKTPYDSPVPVLNELSLTVDQGNMVAIMGPSGSGKSTLLNVLGLMDSPTSGHYRLGDVAVEGLDAGQRRVIRSTVIGFVFQAFHLVDHLSVRDNVALPLTYQGTGRRQRRQRAQELLEQVGLQHRLHARPSTLSGGERQRVAVARALVHSPRLILCDEPTGNLDRVSTGVVMQLLRQLGDETCVVVVTHDPEVAAWADRSFMLRDGALTDA